MFTPETSLHSCCRPRLHFVDAREHGGFWEGHQRLLPEGRGRLDYSIGYRHMVQFAPPHLAFAARGPTRLSPPRSF